MPILASSTACNSGTSFTAASTLSKWIDLDEMRNGQPSVKTKNLTSWSTAINQEIPPQSLSAKGQWLQHRRGSLFLQKCKPKYQAKLLRTTLGVGSICGSTTYIDRNIAGSIQCLMCLLLYWLATDLEGTSAHLGQRCNRSEGAS